MSDWIKIVQKPAVAFGSLQEKTDEWWKFRLMVDGETEKEKKEWSYLEFESRTTGPKT